MTRQAIKFANLLSIWLKTGLKLFNKFINQNPFFLQPLVRDSCIFLRKIERICDYMTMAFLLENKLVLSIKTKRFTGKSQGARQ